MLAPRSRVCATCLGLALCGCRSEPTHAQPLPLTEHSAKPPEPPIRAKPRSSANVIMYHAQDEDEIRDVWIARPRYGDIVGGARVVARASNARLTIDYPLRRPAVFDLPPDQAGSEYTLRGIVRAVAERYAEIYRVEAMTSSKSATKVPGIAKRSETDGKYGIWGYDLHQLVLERVNINTDDAGNVSITIDVSS